jgi:hypothetical protein
VTVEQGPEPHNVERFVLYSVDKNVPDVPYARCRTPECGWWHTDEDFDKFTRAVQQHIAGEGMARLGQVLEVPTKHSLLVIRDGEHLLDEFADEALAKLPKTMGVDAIVILPEGAELELQTPEQQIAALDKAFGRALAASSSRSTRGREVVDELRVDGWALVQVNPPKE